MGLLLYRIPATVIRLEKEKNLAVKIILITYKCTQLCCILRCKPFIKQEIENEIHRQISYYR